MGRDKRPGIRCRWVRRDRNNQRGVTWSLGYADGERAPWGEVVAATARIVPVARVPVTADIEAGYGDTPDTVMNSLAVIIHGGAVGINLEDRTARSCGGCADSIR